MGYVRQHEVIGLTEVTGAPRRTLATFPSAESNIELAVDAEGEIGSIAVQALNMGRHAVFAVGRSEIVAGSQAASSCIVSMRLESWRAFFA